MFVTQGGDRGRSCPGLFELMGLQPGRDAGLWPGRQKGPLARKTDLPSVNERMIGGWKPPLWGLDGYSCRDYFEF